MGSPRQKPLIALLTNNDDDIYCFRKELIESLIEKGVVDEKTAHNATVAITRVRP